MHPHLSALVADQHRHDLLRAAEHHRLLMTARTPRPPRPARASRVSVRIPNLVLLRRLRVLRAPCEQP